jgi:hypothetical protein
MVMLVFGLQRRRPLAGIRKHGRWFKVPAMNVIRYQVECWSAGGTRMAIWLKAGANEILGRSLQANGRSIRAKPRNRAFGSCARLQVV